MKLTEYIAAVKRDLDAFEAEWNAGKHATPDKFPDELTESEWDEQLMAFFAMQGRSEEQC